MGRGRWAREKEKRRGRRRGRTNAEDEAAKDEGDDDEDLAEQVETLLEGSPRLLGTGNGGGDLAGLGALADLDDNAWGVGEEGWARMGGEGR